MNRLRKIVRSALSAVLIAGVVLSSSAIAPMTVTPAEAIAPFTIVKKASVPWAPWPAPLVRPLWGKFSTPPAIQSLPISSGSTPT